ncbi:MAG TPA: tetratricopeptide repeat protein, partial [Planctomycetaceae bacterium]|nr:tetratricopeptide repeat protein [Planctomycetaceae bacterium]
MIEFNPAAADMVTKQQIHSSECLISLNLLLIKEFEALDKDQITLLDLTHSGGTTVDLMDGFWRRDTECAESIRQTTIRKLQTPSDAIGGELLQSPQLRAWDDLGFDPSETRRHIRPITNSTWGSSMRTHRKNNAWFFVSVLVIGLAGPTQAQDVNLLIEREKQISGLIEKGEYKRAEDVAVELLKYTEQNFQRQPKFIGFVLNHLAAAYCQNDKYDEAEQAAKRSIDILRKHVGANDVVLAYPFTNLGATLYRQGRYDEAVEAHQEALTLQQRQDGASLGVAQSLENLGLCYG